jgi:hypothetical protein
LTKYLELSKKIHYLTEIDFNFGNKERRQVWENEVKELNDHFPPSLT